MRLAERILFPNSLLTLFIFTSLSTATVIRVPQEQLTIQAGIDAATNGDTVLVDTGTYVENINFNGKNIVVGSLFVTTGDTSYISKTVIDGDRKGSVVTFRNGEDPTAKLSGMTVTNGSGVLSELLGITFGGGVYCNNSSPSLEYVSVVGNTADFGAGISCDINSSPRLKNVAVRYNNAAAGGGGIDCISNSGPNLANVIVSENTADFGAGISCNDSHPVLVGVTVARNRARSGGGGIYSHESRLNLVNSILWDNAPEQIQLSGSNLSVNIFYSDLEGGEEGIVTEDRRHRKR